MQWFLQSVHDGEIDPHLTFFSDEAEFHLYRHVSSQNNQSQNVENLYLMCEASLCDVKVHVLCIMNAK